MTEPQSQPDHESTAVPEPAKPAEPAAAAAAEQPADPPAAPPAKKAAKKAPAKAAKKPPAKKAAAKKVPPKKAPAKKAPAPAPAPAPAATNGTGRLAEGAKETAAQAKSTVDTAGNPLAAAPSSSLQSPVPLIAAGLLGLFGLLLLRWLLRARRG